MQRPAPPPAGAAFVTLCSAVNSRPGVRVFVHTASSPGQANYRFSGHGLVDSEVHRRRSRSLGATTVRTAGNSGIGDGYRYCSCGRD